MESNWAQTDNAKYLEIKKKVEEKTTKENPLYRQQLVNAVVNFCNEAGPLLDTRNYALTTYMQGSELKERTLKDVDEKLGNLVRVYEDKAESAYTAYIDRLYAAYRIKIDQVNNAGPFYRLPPFRRMNLTIWSCSMLVITPWKLP